MSKSEYMAGVAREVERVRAEFGLTQEALADALGVSQTVVSRYERGEGMISSMTHNRLRTFVAAERKKLAGEAA